MDQATTIELNLVQTGAGGTRTIASENRVLMLGEDLDFEGVYTLSDGKRQALVQLLVKIRSSTVRQDGAMYLVTSEGDLQAAVGFSPSVAQRSCTWRKAALFSSTRFDDNSELRNSVADAVDESSLSSLA